MSAQTSEAVLPNGVGRDESSAQQGSAGAHNTSDQFGTGVQDDSSQRQTRDALLHDARHGESQLDGVRGSSSDPATATTSVQVKPQQPVTTTLNVGGYQNLEHSGLLPERVETPPRTRTPTTAGAQRVGQQPSWLSSVDVPRWFAKLGSILNTGAGVPQGEMAPSPFPGASPFSSPPGGPTFRLRSPARPRAIPPAPTPPSSSSIPAEAIQAEVQRQLHGVLQQLRDFGEQNEQLQMELQEAKAQLRMEQQRNMLQEHTVLRQGGLLGSITTAQLDPGSLAGLPPIGPCGDATTQEQPGSFQPLSAQGPEPVPRTQPSAGSAGVAGPWKSEGDGLGPNNPTAFSVPRADRPEAPGVLRSWWENRGRSATPPPKATASEATGSGQEQVKPGTMTLTAMPDSKETTDAALTFQDWLEVSSSIMSDISESSATCWQGVLSAVERVYVRWLAASPLEKFTIEPVSTEEWCTGKWLRVNARGSSMLLNAMPNDLKADMVSRRCTQDCVRMLYRLYAHYQPGGSAERTEVLKRLQSPAEAAGSETLEGAVKVLRAWPRWLERCRAVQMSPPDPSVLSRGLQALTASHIEGSPDASFRTSMLRASLRLDARPTLEQVIGYHRHLQAELELLLGAKAMSSSTTTTPKLRAIDTGLQPKARDAGSKTGSSPEMCRYFSKATGCKRGDRCSFSHNMSSFDRETRAKKCLRCGSEAHRQRECPVGKQPSKAAAPPPKDTAAGKPGGGGGPTSTQSTMATLGTTSAPTTMTTEPIPGTPWTLESLVAAAQQMVQGQGGESPSAEVSPEKTRPTMKVLRLQDIRVCSMEATTTALLDSGATHSLRTAVSEQEWMDAEQVAVQLAGSHKLVMRITKSGTLLMPCKGSATSGPDELRAQTIVPMGQLIRTLGYAMVWTPDECYLCDETGRKLPLQLEGGCPQLKEMEALSLIARLEDRKLDQLNNEVLDTEDKLKMSAMAMETHWTHYLYDYVTKGAFESGLRAVRDAPFFEDNVGGVWTMYLDMNPGLVKITEDGKPQQVQPQLNKAEVGYTVDIENVIAELTGPLDVTHAVRPEEVT